MTRRSSKSRDVSKRFGGIAGRRRRVLRRARGRDPRAHRPERLGQVDAVQLHPRPAPADARRGAASTAATSPACAPCDLNRLGVSRTFQLLQVFPAAHGAREPDPRRPGASGLDALAPVRPARRRPDRRCRPDDRFLPAGASRRREGRRPLLRPAEAPRCRHGLHGRAAPRAARRAGGRRQPHHAGEPEGAAAGHQRRAGRHLRRDRAQHGVRDVALHAHPRARRGQDHRRRTAARRSATTRRSSRPILDTEPDASTLDERRRPATAR